MISAKRIKAFAQDLSHLVVTSTIIGGLVVVSIRLPRGVVDGVARAVVNTGREVVAFMHLGSPSAPGSLHENKVVGGR